MSVTESSAHRSGAPFAPRYAVTVGSGTAPRGLHFPDIAVEAGAAGYLLKGAPRSDLFAAIRVVHAGGSLLQPLVASTVLRHVARRDQNAGPNTVSLTPREQSVIDLLARGKSNKEIAATLGVTERTAKFHVSAIFTKLGVSNRTEAVARAVHAGLVTLSEN